MAEDVNGRGLVNAEVEAVHFSVLSLIFKGYKLKIIQLHLPAVPLYNNIIFPIALGEEFRHIVILVDPLAVNAVYPVTHLKAFRTFIGAILHKAGEHRGIEARRGGKQDKHYHKAHHEVHK